jgi:hypothetical protein
LESDHNLPNVGRLMRDQIVRIVLTFYAILELVFLEKVIFLKLFTYEKYSKNQQMMHHQTCIFGGKSIFVNAYKHICIVIHFQIMMGREIDTIIAHKKLVTPCTL